MFLIRRCFGAWCGNGGNRLVNELTLNGIRCVVRTAGRGAPLLLLHGFTGSSANWQPHLPALSVDHHVIAPDLIGHGRSGAPADPNRYAMPRAAADLITLLDAVGVAQTALLGYSMGGRLALYTAVHYPDRISHLILESASPGLQTAAERQARQQRDDALAGWIEAHGIEAFVARWEALPLWASQAQLPAEKRQTLRAQRLANNPQGLANSLRGMGTGVQPPLWRALGDVTMPVLLIAGALDEKFVAINRQMARQIPHARLQIVPGAGHTVHLERPSLFQQFVLNFLQDFDFGGRAR